MDEEPAKGDRVIARIAGRQHGVVTGTQLKAARIGPQGIYRRVQAGRLHRLHRGVFAVGHTDLSFEGRCVAAVLALGNESAVSHRSAAAVWGMVRPHDGPIEVTVSGDGGRERRSGIRVHRSSTFVDDFRTLRNGIALTKAPRTLRDLRRTVPQPVFRAALRRALDLRLISSEQVRDSELTRSDLERRFLALCLRHRLPPPEVNARLGSYEVDFLWRAQQVVVETDSWRYHGDRSAFERDRARDAQLQGLGFRVLRVTHRQLTEDRSTVVATLREVLGQRPLGPNL